MTNRSISGRSHTRVANPGLVRPPRIVFAAIVLGLVAHLLWPMSFVSRMIGVPAGIVLVGVAAGLFVGATRAFKTAGTPVPGNQPATAIVKTGPYRFTRNPIYLAFVVFQLGLALLVNSLALVITLLPAISLMAFVVIPREERYLMDRFPVEYAAYKASVRRWL